MKAYVKITYMQYFYLTYNLPLEHVIKDIYIFSDMQCIYTSIQSTSLIGDLKALAAIHLISNMVKPPSFFLHKNNYIVDYVIK